MKDHDTLIIRMKRDGDLCPGETEPKNEAVSMIRCEGGDLSRFKSVKSVQAFEAITKNENSDDPCLKGVAAETFMNLRGSFRRAEGLGTNETSYRAATSAPDGAPCRWARKAETLQLEGDCLEVALSQSALSGIGGDVNVTSRKVDLLRLKAKGGLAQRVFSKDLWFESGTIEVVANNWSGTITYRGRPTPPRRTSRVFEVPLVWMRNNEERIRLRPNARSLILDCP